jgi:excisionase family DNA binding protein
MDRVRKDPRGDKAMLNDLLTAEEVAERLRLKHDTITTWARQGRIPAHRLTRKVIRFRLSEVLAALDAATAGGSTGSTAQCRGAGHVPRA